MRLLFAVIISLSTSLNGWSGGMASHIEEQCHLVQGEHHDESLAAHEKAHHATPGHESHDSKKSCEPEHCSDHCTICHVSISGFICLNPVVRVRNAASQDEKIATDLEKLSSISLRPDTPPPKA